MKMTRLERANLEAALEKASKSCGYPFYSLCNFSEYESHEDGYVSFVKDCKWSLDKFMVIGYNMTAEQIYKTLNMQGPIGMAYASKLTVGFNEFGNELPLKEAVKIAGKYNVMSFSFPRWKDVAFATIGYAYRKATNSSNNREEKIMKAIDAAISCAEKYDPNLSGFYFNLTSHNWKQDPEEFISNLRFCIKSTNDNNLEYYGTKVLIQLLQSLVNYQAMQQG